ncbi:unnamed protein product [Blepharisma stoltei]|uniref:Uncharacterized protein n=1 Tax=Blepharisma stoltei TaxID=1481888 RepID=A0AAU9IM36_9CILI|nr:unnamed protein product [Blepharisma stoltei]
MEREAENLERANLQSTSTEGAAYYDANNKFKATSEGCLVEYLKSHGSATLSELENHIESNFSLLRNQKGKKYVQIPEQLTRSTLIRNRRIFNLDQNEKWSLIAGNLEDFENEQIALISKYAKKKLEKQKQKEEEKAQYLVFKNLLKLDKVLREETKEGAGVKKAIDEAYAYAKIAHNK